MLFRQKQLLILVGVILLDKMSFNCVYEKLVLSCTPESTISHLVYGCMYHV
jgi:hypothetical protein